MPTNVDITSNKQINRARVSVPGREGIKGFTPPPDTVDVNFPGNYTEKKNNHTRPVAT